MRHPWKKLFHIKDFSPLRMYKTLEPNMSFIRNVRGHGPIMAHETVSEIRKCCTSVDPVLDRLSQRQLHGGSALALSLPPPHPIEVARADLARGLRSVRCEQGQNGGVRHMFGPFGPSTNYEKLSDRNLPWSKLEEVL